MTTAAAPLIEAERPDQGALDRHPGHREVLHRSLGLGPVERVAGDPHLAHRVVLDAGKLVGAFGGSRCPVVASVMPTVLPQSRPRRTPGRRTAGRPVQAPQPVPAARRPGARPLPCGGRAVRPPPCSPLPPWPLHHGVHAAARHMGQTTSDFRPQVPQVVVDAATPPPGTVGPVPKLPGLVGRADELAQLADLVTLAADGRPGLALLSGEAGAGKTRLLDELVGRVPRRTLVCRGTGVGFLGGRIQRLQIFLHLLQLPHSSIADEARFQG